MRIGLAVYGTTFSMGLHPASKRARITVQQLMDQALAAHLQGVEIPVSLLEGEDIPAVALHYRDHLPHVFVELFRLPEQGRVQSAVEYQVFPVLLF